MNFLNKTIKWPKTKLAKRPAFGALFGLSPAAAQAVPLTFDQITEAPTESNLLGEASLEQTIYFLNVATENGQTVDAKVTTTVKGDTDFPDQTSPNTSQQTKAMVWCL